MVSFAQARALKAAGLEWVPKIYDFFAVPDREMDDQRFVMSQMMCYVERRSGELLITFHGALEWALDYVVLGEVLWLPTEAQVREEVERRLITEPRPTITLSSTLDGYRCEIQHAGSNLAFEAFGAADAYGQALLYLLQRGT